MSLNQYNESDEELLQHSKESLIRIISYWKGRAKSTEANLKDLIDEVDQLEHHIEYIEDEYMCERSDWDE